MLSLAFFIIQSFCYFFALYASVIIDNSANKDVCLAKVGESLPAQVIVFNGNNLAVVRQFYGFDDRLHVGYSKFRMRIDVVGLLYGYAVKQSQLVRSVREATIALPSALCLISEAVGPRAVLGLYADVAVVVVLQFEAGMQLCHGLFIVAPHNTIAVWRNH